MTSDTERSGDTPGSTDTSEASRGRPRDIERTAAIIDATHNVMHSKGWNDLTMSDIAKEAGCGLATIYRRWATKEELVAAAMLERPLPEIEETGDARADLELLLLAMGDEMEQMGSSIIGFIAATQTDETLHNAFAESVLSIARPRFAELFGQILGPENPHIELLIDGVVVGSLVLRSGVLETFESPQAWTAEVLALVDALASV